MSIASIQNIIQMDIDDQHLKQDTWTRVEDIQEHVEVQDIILKQDEREDMKK